MAALVALQAGGHRGSPNCSSAHGVNGSLRASNSSMNCLPNRRQAPSTASRGGWPLSSSSTMPHSSPVHGQPISNVHSQSSRVSALRRLLLRFRTGITCGSHTSYLAAFAVLRPAAHPNRVRGRGSGTCFAPCAQCRTTARISGSQTGRALRDPAPPARRGPFRPRQGIRRRGGANAYDARPDHSHRGLVATMPWRCATGGRVVAVWSKCDLKIF